MISTAELIIFFRILIAHIIADFFLQRYTWIVEKRKGLRSPYLYFHALIVGILTYLFLADWLQWQLPLFILITHFLIDWWKTTQPDCTRSFIIDQLLHLLMIVIGWAWYIQFDIAHLFHGFSLLNNSPFWIILTGYLIVLTPVGFLIDKITAGWQEDLEKLPSNLQGLTKAGTWIGYLERIIILTFLIVGQFSAIGFLIAAKSIFRFSGKSDNDNNIRKHAEYIIIGTFMSFLFAVLVGMGTRYLLKL
jgi:hypothetical protein